MHKSTTIFKSIIFSILLFPVAAEFCGDESSLLIAQEKKEFITDKLTKTKETQSTTIPNAPQTTGDTVTVKDDANNVLMTVTDEGSAGSVKLNDAGAVTPSTNKLYNNGGSLYWNGSALTTGSGVTEINDLTDAKSDGASVFIGISAGQNDDAGASDGVKNNNTAVGRGALGENLTGNRNTAIGYTALNENSTGNRNTGIGYQVLNDNITGSGNIALGYLAGHDETGSDKLYIENSSSLTPLIWGDFANDSVRINGTFDVTTKTITPQLQIITGATDGYVLTSDATGNASWQIVASGGATEINDLTDAKYDGSSLFLGNGSGVSDDGTANSNTAVGKDALNSNTSGVGNSATGFQALWKNTTGKMNSAIGGSALSNNTTGDANTASGHLSLNSNTTADSNSAFGWQALRFNTTGSSNTATGTAALWKNTIGYNNTASGQNALYSNQTGNNNTAIGYNSLKKNTASGNTATGNNALTTNTIGANNAALGDNALKNNVDGDGNVGLGKSALFTNNSGGGNIGVGLNSLYKNTSGSTNIALGQGSEYYNTTGSNNIGIGYRANLNNTIGANNTIIGHDAGGGGGSHSKSGSVFIGHQAGFSETTDNKLYIENSNSVSPLIWGDFTEDSIKINGGLEITSKTKTPLLQVTTGAINGYVLTSDVEGNATWQAGSSGSGLSVINDLSDGKSDASSLFLGAGAGTNDDGGASDGFTNDNTALGINALQSNITGFYNTANGYSVLYSNTTGSYNTANGYRALYSNTTGGFNTAIGYNSLEQNTNGKVNTATGFNALRSNTGGQFNTATGADCLQGNTTGSSNSAIGRQSLYINTIGYWNTAIGNWALGQNTTGYENVAVGGQANNGNQEGSRNTIIGFKAGSGEANHNKSGNVFLGYKAGYYELANNKLYINNDSSTSPLIWGDFANDRLVVNGSSTDNTNDRTFFSNGSAGGTEAWHNDSDRRLKKNISTINNALEKVKSLRGVNYEWKNTEHRSSGTQMGFIAQEANEVIPEVVDDSGESYSMQYAPITALLVEAVKEQEASIKYQDMRIKTLEEENKNLKTVINENKDLRNEMNLIKAALNKLVKQTPHLKVSSN